MNYGGASDKSISPMMMMEVVGKLTYKSIQAHHSQVFLPSEDGVNEHILMPFCNQPVYHKPLLKRNFIRIAFGSRVNLANDVHFRMIMMMMQIQ